MAIIQHAFQPEQTLSGGDAHFKNLNIDTIDLEHVGVSQLLGRDYVFVDGNYVDLPNRHVTAMQNLFETLIKQLALAETHTVVVTVKQISGQSPIFIRHDLTWYKHKICRIESFTINSAEQQEFMDMIWQCSTSAVTS